MRIVRRDHVTGRGGGELGHSHSGLGEYEHPQKAAVGKHGL